jgi:hypothetical protein
VLASGHKLQSIAAATAPDSLTAACALRNAAQHALHCGGSDEGVRGVHVRRLWYPDTHDCIPIYG